MNTSPGRSRPDLYRQAVRAAGLGLGANLLLGSVKLLGGIFGGSFGLISDAVNSLGDALTSAVVLFGLVVAQRPPDAEHPYGHTRAEAVAASNVAVLILFSAALVGWEAINRLLESPQPPAPFWPLWIAAGSVAVKEILYRYKIRVAARTGSAALLANAWDHRSDAFCSLAVVIGLAAEYWGGPRFHSADSIAALVVVGLVVWSTARLYRTTAAELLDQQADDGLVRQIEDIARAIPDVRGVETLWVRKSGLEYFVDIHIEVDGTMTVEDGHRIGHRVKDRLLAEFPNLRDVLVHLEPHDQTASQPG